MKTTKNSEMRAEYDFSGGVRGKYARRYAQGTNVVLLDPDVAKVFKDPASVNAVLRKLIPLRQAKKAPKSVVKSAVGLVKKVRVSKAMTVQEKTPKYGKKA